MYLNKIKLKNFRSFESADVCFQKDLTIFAGENNGGKSNAIDGIRLLTIPLGGRREIYCEAADVRFHAEPSVFELEAHYADLSLAQKGRFISAATDVSLDKVIFGLKFDATKTGIVRPSFWAGRPGGTPEQGCHEMIRHVYLPPLRDAKRALASGNPTRIMALLNHFLEGSSSADVAKLLARATSHPILGKVDTAVQKSLQALTTGVRRQVASLGFSTDEKLTDIARDLRFKLADHGVAPEDLQYSGHGYANLLYMAIIAVELEKVKTADLTLFLVEEPEAHLHPQLQAAVLCFLQEQAEHSRKPETGDGPAGELQIIVATHSPNLSAWVPSEKLVVFKSVIVPASTEKVKERKETNMESGVADTASTPVREEPSEAIEEGTAPAGTAGGSSISRRATRCIPLANISLKPEDRRKIDRYLDVTKAAFLFGGRMLLVEGIAEALLLPVIAKYHVLKDQLDNYRLFRSAVFVPIEGVDFEPYVSLLLTTHDGVRIADRLVVMTDGDDGDIEENEIPAGTRRKTALDALVISLGAMDQFQAVVNIYSLEAELVRSGNGDLMRKAYIQLHPRSGTKWDTAISQSGDDAQALAIKILFKDVRKGDFAQLLAQYIEAGEAFTVPEYIKNTIEALVTA